MRPTLLAAATMCRRRELRARRGGSSTSRYSSASRPVMTSSVIHASAQLASEAAKSGIVKTQACSTQTGCGFARQKGVSPRRLSATYVHTATFVLTGGVHYTPNATTPHTASHDTTTQHHATKHNTARNARTQQRTHSTIAHAQFTRHVRTTV